MVPIVLFTAHQEAAWLDPVAAGLAAVWVKPMALEDLLDGIEALLRP
jgi:hypothetical protein